MVLLWPAIHDLGASMHSIAIALLLSRMEPLITYTERSKANDIVCIKITAPDRTDQTLL
jgi:hypothetical protein